MSNRIPARLARPLALAGLCLFSLVAAHGQAPALVLPSPPPSASPLPLLPLPEPAPVYELGAGDQITVSVVDEPAFGEKPYRIDQNGLIKMPLLEDRIPAASLTTEQLEKEISSRLKAYIKAPQVTVTVVEFHSQPVSVLGAVRAPGTVQLAGRRTLVEVLSLAGGLADDAGRTVKIVRRSEYGRIPLPSATVVQPGDYSVAEVGIKEIMDATNPAANIVIFPQDVISVARAEMIFVVGSVARAGGFELRAGAGISVLQAVALAGGPDKTAAVKKAQILRTPLGGGARTEIPINIPKILAGKAGDVPLQPTDILYIPSSTSKKVLGRVTDIAAATAGLLVYRLP